MIFVRVIISIMTTTLFYFTLFFKVTVVLSLFASVCLTSKFDDDNPITLVSDRDLSFTRVSVDGIYQFGDSISDTGNQIRADPSLNCGNWPYGQTFFEKPTGRCSDGLLMIDYFATFLNLPLLDAYLNKDGNFTHGVNFAVAGSSALSAYILEEKYDISAPTNLSLSVQLGWFKSYLDYVNHDAPDRKSKLANKLVFMGEVGGNDYNFAFTQGKTLENAYKMVFYVIREIRNAVEEIINLGATRVVIPGNFAIGCVPMYLSLFKTNDSKMYDEMKCLKEYNAHAEFHNDQLQKTINELQKGHPNVTIIYMDYYRAHKEIIQDASLLGFDESVTQMACCGVNDDEYKVNIEICCGNDGVSVCENPEEYVSWDGTHFTQQAYHVMANKLLPTIFLALQ